MLHFYLDLKIEFYVFCRDIYLFFPFFSWGGKTGTKVLDTARGYILIKKSKLSREQQSLKNRLVL